MKMINFNFDKTSYNCQMYLQVRICIVPMEDYIIATHFQMYNIGIK